MANNITRTITTYTHYFGKFSPATGQTTVTATYVSNIRLGSRQITALKKSNPEITGNLLDVVENETLYSMPLDLFLKYATPVSPDEK